ncbi:PREDICTED: carbohydrate sulfotransferase 10-like [Branchiostoma belcheri]|uniref:Carbohydrate sulfotransferase n=1 Tax=Branchiostoma belcheri TaxID=7741 RepID=A0A6P4ZNE8_BRABE|nr:PREDICTED: carbohydrate sulfotransferase 10-like [Branchiostoma belcheri]
MGFKIQCFLFSTLIVGFIIAMNMFKNSLTEKGPPYSWKHGLRIRTGALKNQENPFIYDQKQRQRKALIDNYCKRNVSGYHVPPERYPMHFFVSKKYKVLYCKVGKTGSTTTNTLITNLEYGTNLSQRQYWKNRRVLPLKKFASYSKNEQNLNLSAYRKLLVVRNPLERLASAYFYFFGGKYVSAPRQINYSKQYQGMLGTICSNASTMKTACSEDIKTVQVKNISYQLIPFLAFIRAVAKNVTEWENEHWALISDMCTPCQIPFDFIAHTETLADDLKQFFRNVGVKGRNDIFPYKKTRLGNEKLFNIFSQIPLTDIRRIGTKFKPDFEMFGYSFEAFFLNLL